ncbi:uncharacterized protein [Anabrus simplex]|uniref:uncharacterized protein isoform X3 n=1 Tax=Anabrus simplex TaxID=316456 RepID=UPI0035A37592
MDQKVEIKVETVWLEERADNYELLSEETHLKEETKSELAEPGQTQVKTFELFADVKDEIFKEEHTGGQLHASSKDGDNGQSVK